MKITTFLEFVLCKMIGPPTETRGNGESQWDCPECDHPRFHTMPEKPQFKHRAKCWRCDFRGDVADMVKAFHPDESWPDRRQRIEDLRREYESYTSSGDGDLQVPSHDEMELQRQRKAFIELMRLFEAQETADAFGFQIIGQAVKICEKHNVPVKEVYKDWKRYQWSKNWWAQIEKAVEETAVRNGRF